MFLSAAMMLDWLSLRHDAPQLEVGARLIERAIEKALSTRSAVPMEYGGSAGTSDMTKSVVAALRDVTREVA